VEESDCLCVVLKFNVFLEVFLMHLGVIYVGTRKGGGGGGGGRGYLANVAMSRNNTLCRGEHFTLSSFLLASLGVL